MSEFEAHLAAQAALLRELEATEAAERRAHAGDLAWVTRDRDVALAALDALTDLPAGAWSPWLPSSICMDAWSARVQLPTALRSREASMGPVPWVTNDPQEAWELLQARDLAPLVDDATRRFRCHRCGGRGVVPSGGEYPEREACDTCAIEDEDATGGYRTRGWMERPSTLPDLVAWASLGLAATEDGGRLVAPGIGNLEAWAREAYRAHDELLGPSDWGFPRRERPPHLTWVVRRGSEWENALHAMSGEWREHVPAGDDLWRAGVAIVGMETNAALLIPTVGVLT